jgi:putative ATP-dependent endonuclease of OLD family
MVIKTVEVKNFRSIKEACLECEDLVAIVGRNGAGKSSFLHAIDAFYDIAAPITEEDFFERDTDAPIEIRVTYGALTDYEREEFSTYIRDDTLMVTKRMLQENGRFSHRYYAASLQIPQFADIRAISGKRARIEKWNELIDTDALPNLGGRVRSSDQVERLMREYECDHPELTEPLEREEQFFGPRNIGGGKLDKYTKYVLVPAVREASEEASGRKGAIYQILDTIVLRKIDSRKDIQEFKSEFQDKARVLYSSDNLTELPELGSSISQTLEKFAPGSRLNLGWDEVKLPEIHPPEAKATLIEDDYEGEISRKGHGLQRALILTLLQHLAMTVPEAVPEPGAQGEEVVLPAPSQGPDLILAIEEPELYLHPSRCRYLANLLLKLTQGPGMGLGAKNQIIYTTHSPYFVDLHRFDKIRMLRKITLEDSVTPQTKVTRYTLKQAAAELAKVCQTDPATFTSDTFKVHATCVMNSIVNEGFFADLVVVVEGPSEVATLWKLQEIMKKGWDEQGIVVVPAGGKNNIDRPVLIFRGLAIPTYFMFDGDAHLTDGGKRKNAKTSNHRLLRLAGAQEQDFPATQVNPDWAVFKENLEGVVGQALGNNVFDAIRGQVASEFAYDSPDKACKNFEGAARVIELIYEKGHEIPKLEEVVQKITEMRIVQKS